MWWVWLLFASVALARLQVDDSDVWIPDTSGDDLPGPSDFMAAVHDPNPSTLSIHQVSRSFLRITKDYLSLTPRTATQQRDVSKSLRLLRSLRPEDLSSLLSEQGIVMPPREEVSCGPSTAHYRTMDGSCNNPQNPCWGKAEEPYQRWLPPDYANGVDAPRSSLDGSALPPARVVYLAVSGEFNPTAQTQIPYITNLLVTWGQLLSHEILFTPTVKVKTWDGNKMVDKKLICCNSTAEHPDCMPFIIRHHDSYFPQGHCMEFVRSVAYAHRASGCAPPALGNRREQMNQLTSFIDASVVYGVSEEAMRKLREHGGRGARLTMTQSFGRSYLPRANGTCKSSRNACDKRCHMGGEKRANENPSLAALHTVLARHHNRLVEELRGRGWDEETLFHVVRKIVGAQMQHITYNEFLPLVLGHRLLETLKLKVPTEAYQYDSSINPNLYNVFVTAAYRFGHSMIPGRQKRRGKRLIGSPVLSQDFFSMDDFCDTSSDSVTRLLGGQAEQMAQRVDVVFTKELTNHLFSKTPDGPGLDLVSINIQRGREHGLPSYNRWREACGLGKAKDYVDLRGQMPDFVVERLAMAYGPGRVDDIDLYIAGLSEFPVNDGILGPTFTCIVANQFRNLKYGDRFWYENLDHPGAFTQDQLKEIRKTTLASLICANTDVGELQPLAFVAESSDNPKWPCDLIMQLRSPNLNLW